jgi:hypothetical protein
MRRDDVGPSPALTNSRILFSSLLSMLLSGFRDHSTRKHEPGVLGESHVGQALRWTIGVEQKGWTLPHLGEFLDDHKRAQICSDCPER